MSTINVIAGKHCPKCNQDGGLFYHEDGTNPQFYLCENCHAHMSVEKFEDALIANWLGFKYSQSRIGIEMWTNEELEAKGINLKKGIVVFQLPFRYKFDWLMLAVLKAEQGDIGFKMCRKRVEVYIHSTKETIIEVKEASRIQSLFKAVVRFIKWSDPKYSI